MRRRGKQANLQRLGSVIQGILKKHNISFDPEELRLHDVWYKAVGPQISAQTRPDRIRRNTLFVKVSSSVWMQQLHNLKNEIMEKFNQLMGKELVRDIYFSIGEITPTLPKESHPELFSLEAYPLKDREKKLIEKRTSSVADKELKEILKRVMTKNIIRRRLSGTRKSP